MVESGPYIEYCCMPYVRVDYVVSLVALGLLLVALLHLVIFMFNFYAVRRLRSKARLRAEKCPVGSNIAE